MELREEKVGSRLNGRKDISTHKREEPLVVERELPVKNYLYPVEKIS